MIELTRDEAEQIAYWWLRKQESAIDCNGGYPGSLYVVRDMLVSFINSNGMKYDGPQLDIITKDRALEMAKAEFDWDGEDPQGWRKIEARFGESVPSLADYLMTTDGGPDEYSPGNPYKEGAPALRAFAEFNANRESKS